MDLGNRPGGGKGLGGVERGEFMFKMCCMKEEYIKKTVPLRCLAFWFSISC